MSNEFPRRRLVDEILFVSAKKTEHELEVKHERELARIRAESHALVWTGTAEELTATITRWYESGWLIAASPQDALQKAAIHFVKPDGTLVIKPSAPTAEQDTSAIFSPSATYQKLIFRGKEHDLTGHSHAPGILKVLHESLKRGEPGLTTKQIRERAKLPHNGKMYDWFRGTGLWKNLVVSSGPDMYRLDIFPLP
jgi:hypothetical protein